MSTFDTASTHDGPQLVGVSPELNEKIQRAWDHATSPIKTANHTAYWTDLADRNEPLLSLYQEMFDAIPGGNLLTQMLIDARSYRQDLIKRARENAAEIILAVTP